MQKFNSLLLVFFLLTAICYAQSVPSPEHRLREQNYDVKFYFLDLDIEKASPAISGNVLIRAKSLVDNLDTFAVELASNLTIDSAKISIDGGAFDTVSVVRNNNEVNLIMLSAASENQIVEARIYYHGSPTVSVGLNSGFFSSNNPSPHKFSASPPYNSYTWWPCKQEITDKADSSWFFITTNDSSTALSNGLLTKTVTLSGNKKRWEWKSKYPIAFYNISFVVGVYTETTEYWHPKGRTDSMALKFYNYTPPSPNEIQNILDVFSELYGLYPFYDEQLAISKVDLGGGIENQTSISLGVGGVDVHEIAHQWFGDNVTCGSWKDVALNEGFAEYSVAIYEEFETGVSNPSKRISRMNAFESNATSKPQGSIYAPLDTTSALGVFLDQAMYYRKAACVYNTLRFVIDSDSLFFQGIKNYQTQFGGKTAIGSDLKSVMEAVSGKDLTDFFNQWYYGFGYPTFNTKWVQRGNHLAIQLTQIASSGKTPLFKTPLEIKILRSNGDTTVRLFVSQLISDYDIVSNGTVTGIVIDPNQWVINKAGPIVNDSTLSVRTISPDNNYSVFPNPASGYLQIKNKSNLHQPLDTEIFNLTGEKIFAGKTETDGMLYLPDVATGIYFLRVNKGSYYKIMISH